MDKLDIAIQIVNYNTKRFIEPLVDSITKDLADSNINYKILILDNNSNDNLSDIQKRWKLDKVKIYYSKTNNGFGAGHNALEEKTDASYILILNPDILIFEKHTIERMLKVLKLYKAAVIGPALVTTNREIQSEIMISRTIRNTKAQNWDHGELGSKNIVQAAKFKKRDKLGEVGWVSGAVMLIDHAVFKAAGGFDANFFLYYEEEDLCLRFRQKNYKIIYDPSVHIFHYGSVVAKKSKFFAKSLAYYIKKNGISGL